MGPISSYESEDGNFNADVFMKEERIFFSDGTDVDVSMCDGIDGKGRYRLDAQLLYYILTVGDDGGEGDMQLVSNFLVDLALGQEGEYLDLTVGKNLLFGRMLKNLCRQIFTMSVAVLFQNKDLPDELLLRYIDAQRPKTGELMGRIILHGQYDGLVYERREVIAVGDDDARCNEVMVILFRFVSLQFVEREKAVDDGKGHHLCQ